MIKIITAAGLALALAAGANADADKNYGKFCAKCHGVTGAGDGKAAKLLKPKPTDFTDAKIQAERTDEQLFEATKEGSKAKSVKVGKKMPAFGKKLKDEEIKELVALMRSFKK